VHESTQGERGADSATTHAVLAHEIAALTRWAHERGWVPATSGNFSALLSTDPFRLAITASGRDKGTVSEADIVVVDELGEPVDSELHPSAETLLHIVIARTRGAKVIAHVHSMWATLASERVSNARTVEFHGLELLKAFEGVATHEHRESVPIVENTQDWSAAAPGIERTLAESPSAHGFLIRGHGLYTWAGSTASARRHLEAFDYLFEYETRRTALGRV
jgi:methylthioribulose-1-phosphate dehydratase